MKKIQYDRNTKSNGPKRLQKSWTTASTLSRLRNSISGFSQKSKLQNLLKVTLQRCSHCSCIAGLFVTAAAGTSDVTNGLHTVWQTYRDTTVKSSPKAFASSHSCVRFELLYNIHQYSWAFGAVMHFIAFHWFRSRSNIWSPCAVAGSSLRLIRIGRGRSCKLSSPRRPYGKQCLSWRWLKVHQSV